MKTIIIKTQEELDALPSNFDEFTYIEIRSEKTKIIHVKVNKGNSIVEAYGNSSVEARGNSSVVARGNSIVVARENSSVVARENSSVVAWENSIVVAWENSSVEARGNSIVVACGNSSVEAYGNSSVEARGNSSVEAYEFAMLSVISSLVIIKHLADYSVARFKFKGKMSCIEKKDATASALFTEESINIPFETWLERGWVVADGITQKLVSKKKIKDVEVFTVTNFPHKKESYVVKRGEVFSHGDTVKQAINDLKYKISSRDTSQFKKWKLDKVITEEEAINAYRSITGACESGTRMFCESIKVPKKLTVKKVIELTDGRFGSDQFKEFFSK